MTSEHRTPDQFRQRDLAAMHFVGREHVALIESIGRQIGGGKQLGHLARRLADQGDLMLHSRALDGGVSYCQLTQRACERIGVPKERSEPLATHALDKALAVHTWCCLSNVRRYRCERKDAEVILGLRLPPNQVHCLSDENGTHVVYRVHLLQGHPEASLRSLHEEVENGKREIAKAISRRQYGFVFLVDSEAKQKKMTLALSRTGFGPNGELVVRVELSATASTIASYLRRSRKDKE